MKRIQISLSVFTVVIMLIFSACGSNESDSKKESHPIVGKWEIVKAEGEFADMNKGQIYEFLPDGKAKISYANYTYKFVGDTLFMDYEGAGKIIVKSIYKIDGDKMTLYNATDGNQKFFMERR